MARASKPLVALGVALLLVLGIFVAIEDTSARPTWRIGLEAPLTGDQSTLGKGMLEGAQLAAAQANAAGGVLGRDIQIVPIDDQANADKGVAAVNAALASHLDGVVGPYNSSVGVKTLPIYVAHALIPIRLTSAASTSGYGYTVQPMESQIAPVATEALSGWMKAKSVAIVYDPTSQYTKGVAKQVRSNLEPAGVTITMFKEIQPGKAGYDNVMREALATTPDAVYAAVYMPEGAKMAKALVTAGSTTNCLMDYASYDSGFVAAAGHPAAEHCSVLGVPAPQDFQDDTRQVGAFQAKFGHVPGTWSPYTYDSLNLLLDAARKAKSFNDVALRPILATTHRWYGWTGIVNIELVSGDRTPATVVVTQTKGGELRLDHSWAKSAGVLAQKVHIEADLTSQGTALHQVDPSVTYGTNLLTGVSGGSAETEAGVEVSMQGNVLYNYGTGPLFGFVTFTFPNGSTLATQMTGHASKSLFDQTTTFHARLIIIGGTGIYQAATGTGTFSGSRDGKIGSSVNSAFTISLRGQN
jgi:ABC-type branched-subunit amino acid transport system substrate-binding protein